jgi:hypothetical protein
MADRQTYRRLLEPPKGSFFLFGVRGVGKSTWTRAAFPQAHTFDLLDEGLYHSLLSEPSTFAAELAALPRSTPVIVDEVQRVPALLNEVHRAMETRRQRFILLGSSARRLKTAGTNLLAGRAVVKTMLPFVPAELAEDFDLERTLRYGALPVVWHAPTRVHGRPGRAESDHRPARPAPPDSALPRGAASADRRRHRHLATRNVARSPGHWPRLAVGRPVVGGSLQISGSSRPRGSGR